MTTITRFDHYNKDGYDIYIERGTGRVAASVSSYARMSGLDKSTISRRLTKGVAQNEVETVEILTPGGLQGVALIWEHTIANWIVRDNPEQSKKMIMAGVRVFLHGLVGHSVKPEPQTPQTYLEAIKAWQAVYPQYELPTEPDLVCDKLPESV